MRIPIFLFLFLLLGLIASSSFAQKKKTSGAKILVSIADSLCIQPVKFNLSATPPLFSTTTDISFELPSSGIIVVQIFDFTGRLVRTIVNGSLDSGWHHFTWNGSSDRGALLSSGYYTCIASGLGRSDYAKIDLVR